MPRGILMTEEPGEYYEEPPTWREIRQQKMAERAQRQALQTRIVQNAAAKAGIAHLAKRFDVNVKQLKQWPRTEPLNDAESNEREQMLRAQAEKLRGMHE